MTDRRTFLRKLGATAVVTAGAAVALPSPAKTVVIDAVSAEADETGDDVLGGLAVEVSDEGIGDEDDSPIALWQYRSTRSGFEPTSPINVVFPLSDREAGLAEVMDVLEDAGWKRSPEEYVRYAWNRELGTYDHQHATAAQTHFGASGRLHVRCWSFEGVVSMQVHGDSRALPRHRVTGYDHPRSAVESLYAAAGWRVKPNAIRLENEKRDHDGTATVVRPGGDA